MLGMEFCATDLRATVAFLKKNKQTNKQTNKQATKQKTLGGLFWYPKQYFYLSESQRDDTISLSTQLPDDISNEENSNFSTH